jgi:cyclophilin family peptidyl-prolyl cis-trans isomerase
MAQHKAPTSVTVAPLAEKTPFEQWVSRYWVHCALGFVAIILFVVVRHFMNRQATQAVDANWSLITAQTIPNALTQIPEGEPEALARLASDLVGSQAGAAARLLEIRSRIDRGDYAGSRTALAALEQEHADSALIRDTYDVEGRSTTLPGLLARRIEEVEAWKKAHTDWEANPELPEGSPRVRLNTGEGSILLGLYREEAPGHTANFLKLCQEGYYEGTRFHRIQKGFMIQGGDPNSRSEDRDTWGQGGPEEKLPPELNYLRHFAGVLSMAKQGGEAESSGSQFFITTDPAHHLNGVHVVFGKVIEGMDVVQKIVAGEIGPDGPGDRPQDPVVIESIEVL